MSRHAVPILLSPDEEMTLATWARSRSFPLRQAQRAQIVQLAGAGVESQEIARTRGVSRPTAQLWRERFLALRYSAFARQTLVADDAEYSPYAGTSVNPARR